MRGGWIQMGMVSPIMMPKNGILMEMGSRIHWVLIFPAMMVLWSLWIVI